jgi:RimJ/RimL family protein N-acetyltransferase
MIRHWELHDYGRWAVTDKETKRFIGVGGLRSLFGTPELVYHLSTEYWGRGLGTELAQSILSFGFRMRVFERIVAITKPGNLRSQKVMQKVGMTFEKNETYYGMEVVQYSITIEEYARLTASPQWA